VSDAPSAASAPRPWQRLLRVAGAWLGGVLLAFAAGIGLNALAGPDAGRAAFRFVLYSVFFGGLLYAYGRTGTRAAREGLTLGAAIALLRWVLDRVW
jgi:hypothetical protein